MGGSIITRVETALLKMLHPNGTHTEALQEGSAPLDHMEL
jgi:hypothetical protein